MLTLLKNEKTSYMQKARGFSQRQAGLLTKFTRDQLQRLEDREIVLPCKHPTTLYNWNQIIFLKSLFVLRQDWSFKQIEKALGEYEESMVDIEKNIPTAIKLIFGEFGEKPNIKIIIQFEYLLDTVSIEQAERMRDIHSNDSLSSVERYRRQTHVNIPRIIKELKQEAQNLEIEDFELKIM
jgi:hypothetical protein